MPSSASARGPLLAFLASGLGALLCIPAVLIGGSDTVLLLQMVLVAVTFCGAAVYRHRTRVFGDAPGERAPVVLGHPRKAGADASDRLRVTAAWAMALSLLYVVALIALVVAPTLREML